MLDIICVDYDQMKEKAEKLSDNTVKLLESIKKLYEIAYRCADNISDQIAVDEKNMLQMCDTYTGIARSIYNSANMYERCLKKVETMTADDGYLR